MARHLPIHSFLGQLCDVSFAFSSRRVSFIPAHIFSRFAGSHSDERRTVLSLIDQTRGRPWRVYSLVSAPARANLVILYLSDPEEEGQARQRLAQSPPSRNDIRRYLATFIFLSLLSLFSPSLD